MHVFKAPTLSSFPYTATAKFDVGYRNSIYLDSRQKNNWFAETNSKLFGAPREQPKPALLASSASNSDAHAIERTRSRTSSFAIYPSVSKDTYIYERSLSSKSDIFSNDSTSTLSLSPSTLFSPLSTDSTMTARSPTPGPASAALLEDARPSRSSTPTQASHNSNSFPLHIPALARAQSAMRGVFHNERSQGASDVRPDNSFVPHAPIAHPVSLPVPSVDHSLLRTDSSAAQNMASNYLSQPLMSGQSIPSTESSFSIQNGMANFTIHRSISGQSMPSTNSTYSAQNGIYQQQPYYAHPTSSVTNETELDRVTRINAEYNSTSSYSSRRNSLNAEEFSSAHVQAIGHNQDFGGSRTAPEFRDDAGLERGQIFSDLPLHSSPELEQAIPVQRSTTTDPSYMGATVGSDIYARDFVNRTSSSNRPASESVTQVSHRGWDARNDSHDPYLRDADPQSSAHPSWAERKSPERRRSYASVVASQSAEINPSVARTSPQPDSSPSRSQSSDGRQDRPLPVPPPLPLSQRSREENWLIPDAGNLNVNSIRDPTGGQDHFRPRNNSEATRRDTSPPVRSPTEGQVAQRSYSNAPADDYSSVNWDQFRLSAPSAPPSESRQIYQRTPSTSPPPSTQQASDPRSRTRSRANSISRSSSGYPEGPRARRDSSFPDTQVQQTTQVAQEQYPSSLSTAQGYRAADMSRNEATSVSSTQYGAYVPGVCMPPADNSRYDNQASPPHARQVSGR